MSKSKGTKKDETITDENAVSTDAIEGSEDVTSVDNEGTDVAVDDQEADIDGADDELSELGATGDVDVADGKTLEERVDWLEAVALERETVLSDIMGRASATVERLGDLERTVKSLQKKLKVKGGDATMHGSIDNL